MIRKIVFFSLSTFAVIFGIIGILSFCIIFWQGFFASFGYEIMPAKIFRFSGSLMIVSAILTFICYKGFRKAGKEPWSIPKSKIASQT